MYGFITLDQNHSLCWWGFGVRAKRGQPHPLSGSAVGRAAFIEQNRSAGAGPVAEGGDASLEWHLPGLLLLDGTHPQGVHGPQTYPVPFGWMTPAPQYPAP